MEVTLIREKMINIVIHILNIKITVEAKVSRYKILSTLLLDLLKPSRILCVDKRISFKNHLINFISLFLNHIG